MSPQSLALVTMVLVVGGRWATGKKVTGKIVVGGLVMATFVAVLGEWREDFARQVAVLILVGVMLVYAIPVFENLGKVKG